MTGFDMPPGQLEIKRAHTSALSERKKHVGG